MDVLIRLGDFRFSVDTAAYQSLTRQIEMRWNALDRLWNAPTVQFTGQGAETITLEGRIHPGSTGDIQQLNILRDMAQRPLREAKPEPYAMVTGYGEYLGEFVITRVEETQSGIVSRGAPTTQGFSLSLTRYVRDQLQ